MFSIYLKHKIVGTMRFYRKLGKLDSNLIPISIMLRSEFGSLVIPKLIRFH